MNKWYPEDWHYKNEILKVGIENRSTECRLGLRPGDAFDCDFPTQASFYPTSHIKIIPVMEAIRDEGDLRNLGASLAHEIDFMCPDGVVQCKIMGIKQE